MSTSYDPDRLTKTHLDHELKMLESRLKSEISMKAFNVAMGAFLALTYIGFWAMIIVAVAKDTKGEG